MTKKHSKKSRETNREQDQTASMCATVHNGAPIIASTKKKKKQRLLCGNEVSPRLNIEKENKTYIALDIEVYTLNSGILHFLFPSIPNNNHN